MDYLPLMIILGGVSACAIAAYELFDAIERDEYELSSTSSGQARVALLDAGPSAFPRVCPPRSSVRQVDAISVEQGARVGRPDSDPLGVRIRGLEARLERLERECDRIGALAVGTRYVV